MRTRKSLPSLTSWMLRHVTMRRRELAKIPMGRQPLTSDITFPIIDTHNALATFMRRYCLSSLARAYMGNGRRIGGAPGVRGHRAALTFAVRTERPRITGNGPWESRDKPAWHDPNVIIRVLNRAGCSNAKGVNDALSIGSRAIEHLTTARNFLAHRNETTALRVRALGSHYGVGAVTEAVAVVFAVGYGRPQRIVEDWLDDIYTIVSLFPR